MNHILHITTQPEWNRALSAGTYRGDTLDTEGFIHCSTPTQVAEVANRRFAGRSDLLLLYIDPRLVGPEIRYEMAENGQNYPHIYGPLNVDAVMQTIPMLPDQQGRFVQPPKLV
jgi:uncharacterized protein (DUF952 family)